MAANKTIFGLLIEKVSSLGAAARHRLRVLSSDNHLYFDTGTEWINLSELLPVNTQSGTAYTLVATDTGKDVRCTNAAAKAVTVAPTATLGTDFVCIVSNLGAGALTFTPGSGVTLRNNPASVAPYKTASVKAIGTNEYLVTYDETAVGIPAGGATGQVLKKASGTDYDATWQADATGGGGSEGRGTIVMDPNTEEIFVIGGMAAGDYRSRTNLGRPGKIYQSSATVDFGAFPGSSDCQTVITGQSRIRSDSNVQAWIHVADSADHLADEHWVETLQIYAGNMVPGVGFTIFAKNTNQVNEPLQPIKGAKNATLAGGLVAPSAMQMPTAGGKGTFVYGQFNVRWQWR